VSKATSPVGNPYLAEMDIEEVMEPGPPAKRQLVAFPKWSSDAGGSQVLPDVCVTAEDQKAYDEIFEPYGGAAPPSTAPVASRTARGLE
jgi:hypothetical protein